MVVEQFDSSFEAMLPQTSRLLKDGRLVVDPRVSSIILYGSRGPAGGCRPDSDVNLCLVVDDSGLDRESEFEHQAAMKAILEETLSQWQGEAPLDLEAIFDIHGCFMRCLRNPAINIKRCPYHGVDCFGVCKLRRGEAHYMLQTGQQVNRIRPCLEIWSHSRAPSAKVPI